MKIDDCGIIRDMTAEEEKQWRIDMGFEMSTENQDGAEQEE
jgi:hypothetical protein